MGTPRSGQGGTEPPEDVDGVWRYAVATGLVAREVGPVEQQHAGAGPLMQGAERCGCACRPGADDDHVPHRVIARHH